jgi:hypothetical protein
MTKRGELPTHSDVEETVQEHDEKMSEKIEELDVLTEDTETVRGTRDGLDIEMTEEGVEAMMDSVDEAEDETVELFDTEDGNLEEFQSEAEDYANELDERHDTAESNLGELSDASAQIETAETVGKLADAKTSVLEEMDFLQENNQEAEEAREESERAQQELEARINAGRRS